MTLEAILGKLRDKTGSEPRRTPRGDWEARCPAHEDNKASLSVRVGEDGRILLHCFAGCTTEAICQSLGITLSDLFQPKSAPPGGGAPAVQKRAIRPRHGRIVAAYDYHSADGTLLFQVVRFEPKAFRQRRPDGKGGWIYNLDGVPRVLYRLPELAAADPSTPIFVVEGEKDADNLVTVGLAATTNPGGALKWDKLSDDGVLVGRPVAIIPDRDEPGRKHAVDVANRLHGRAASVKILELPDGEWSQSGGKDVSDWLAAHDAQDPETLMAVLLDAYAAAAAFDPHSAEAEADTWQILTLVDACKPRQPLRYVVEGIIAQPSLNIVYGAPGCLKSMLLADLAICVASGGAWLPPFFPDGAASKATIRTPVLWVDLDNGRRRTDERFEALLRARNLPTDIPLYYVSMPIPWLDASQDGPVGQLAARIQRLSVGLCIIDNLGSICWGVDENTAEMIPVMARLRNLVEQSKVALALIHHQRKTTNVRSARSGETLRGHSSIEAAVDLALLCERDEEAGVAMASVRPTKSRDIPVEPFSAELQYTHRPGTQELATAQFFGSRTTIETNSEKAARLVFQSFQTNSTNRPGGQSDFETICSAVRLENEEVSEKLVRQSLAYLVDRGKLCKVKGMHNKHLYEIATAETPVFQFGASL